MIKTFLYSAVFSAIVAIIILVLHYVSPMLIHVKIWDMLLFLLASTVLLQIVGYALQKLKSDTNLYVTSVLSIMGFKLFFSAVFMGYYIYISTPDILLFVGDFFVLYILYSLFVVLSLLRILRAETKTSKTDIQ